MLLCIDNKVLTHDVAIWYDMENRGDDGEVGDADGVEDEGEFEDQGKG